MGWSSSLCAVFVFSAFCLTARDVGAAPIPLTLGTPAAIHADSSRKSIDFLLGIRLGLGKNPRLEAGRDNRNSQSRAGIIGAQVTVVHEKHFTLGFGLEHFATGYTHFRDDTLFGLVEDNQYSGWMFYVSPGVHSRLGKDHPLGFGMQVDAGYLWAKENYLTHQFSSSWSERVLAIRPKLTATYDLVPEMFLQFESGWLFSEKSGHWSSFDYFDGQSHDGYAWKWDFTGFYLGTMLTMPLPKSGGSSPDPRSRAPASRLTPSKPAFVVGLRGGVLPSAVEIRPSRWDFDGDYGSRIASGLQVSLATRHAIELGFGFELMSTPYSVSTDTILGEELHASGTYLYATFVYEGLPTPLKRVPLGVAVDVGRMWARENSRSTNDRWYGSRSAGVEGNAARLKMTISPMLSRPVGLRFEIGWMFASIGQQTPPPKPEYRWPWESPSAMDFSGLSVMAMVRLISL